MRDWIGGIAAWLSQGINCALLSGSPDMTVSARSYINRDRKGCGRAYRAINRVFFWQADHCKRSFQSDVTYAIRVLTEHGSGRIPSDNPIVGQSYEAE